MVRPQQFLHARPQQWRVATRLVKIPGQLFGRVAIERFDENGFGIST
jgi:hypothetical protein